MNFTLNDNIKKAVFFSLLLSCVLINITFSQELPVSGLRIDVGGGYSRSVFNKGSFQFGEYTRAGLSGDIRIIWQSENYLGLGLATGYYPLAFIKQDQFSNEYGVSDVRANLETVPIFADFFFNFNQIFLNAGVGYYLVSSRINAFGVKSFSNTFDFGFSFSCGYLNMLNKKIGYGAEIKSHHLVDTPQLAFSLHLFLCLNISEL